jgi:DNA-binding NtrC family response regulator
MAISYMEQENMEKSSFAILSESGRTVNGIILGYLRNSGYQVDIFHDQTSALKSIDKCGYTLLLVDIDIPGLDVLSLLSNTSQICPETSMIIITGSDRMNDAMQALRMGAADILVKPVDLFHLDAALEKSIRLSKLVIDHMKALENITEAQAALSSLKQQNSQLLDENKRLRMEAQ